MEGSEERLARMREGQRKCVEPYWILAQAKAALDRGQAAVLIVAPEAASPLGADEAQRVQELLGSLKELLEGGARKAARKDAREDEQEAAAAPGRAREEGPAGAGDGADAAGPMEEAGSAAAGGSAGVKGPRREGGE